MSDSYPPGDGNSESRIRGREVADEVKSARTVRCGGTENEAGKRIATMDAGHKPEMKAAPGKQNSPASTATAPAPCTTPLPITVYFRVASRLPFLRPARPRIHTIYEDTGPVFSPPLASGIYSPRALAFPRGRYDIAANLFWIPFVCSLANSVKRKRPRRKRNRRGRNVQCCVEPLRLKSPDRVTDPCYRHFECDQWTAWEDRRRDTDRRRCG